MASTQCVTVGDALSEDRIWSWLQTFNLQMMRGACTLRVERDALGDLRSIRSSAQAENRARPCERTSSIIEQRHEDRARIETLQPTLPYRPCSSSRARPRAGTGMKLAVRPVISDRR
jgi:hypothetical protein